VDQMKRKIIYGLGIAAVLIGIAASAGLFFHAPQDKSFGRMVGRWMRPDGGYVLEIKGVKPGGKLDAAYYNPSPIHVARAEASQGGGAIRVFVELRDVNYPGSTYTLSYDPTRDRLQGEYYQAVAQERYAVFFVRIK
jgi:hypothetical protein